MQLRQLEYVAAIMRYKTMRKAASHLYISEATMSQQLRALEKELGFSLFERDGRLLHLSTEGENLLPDLQMLLRAKQQLEQRVMTIKNPSSGSFRLGIAPGTAEILLPVIFERFTHLYPQIALDVYADDPVTLVERVKTRRTDLALFGTVDLIPLDLEHLTIERLYATELVAVASQHHRLAPKERISKRQLESEAIIAFSEGFLINDLLYAVLGTRLDTKVICTTNNPIMALPLLQAGRGFMFLPKFVMEAPQMKTKLCGLRILDLAPELKFPVYHACVYHQQHPRSEQLNSLVRIMKDCFHSVIPFSPFAASDSTKISNVCC